MYRLADLRNKLSGAERIRAHIGGGSQIANSVGQTAELAPNASIDQIAAAMRILKIVTKEPMTIADQLKLARARLEEARNRASSAVAESTQVANLALESIALVEKDTADMRAELVGLNGGPA